MTTVDPGSIETALRQAMLNHAEAGDFDLNREPDTSLIELATDDWTLQVDASGEAVTSWFSIDNEPESAHEYPVAVRNTLRAAELAALTEANLALAGELASSLDRSGDPLSAYLAGELTR